MTRRAARNSKTVGLWWNRFGPALAAKIRKKRTSYPMQYSNWRWHIDEVFVKIGGETHYIGPAVGHEGEVLEAVVTKRHDKKAVLKVLKALIKRYGQPTAIVTDKLKSYRSAMKELGFQNKQEVGGRLNNRAENNHLLFQQQGYAMQGFRKEETLQKFTSVHAQIYNHFNGERHLVNRQIFKEFRSESMTE